MQANLSTCNHAHCLQVPEGEREVYSSAKQSLRGRDAELLQQALAEAV